MTRRAGKNRTPQPDRNSVSLTGKAREYFPDSTTPIKETL
jgi:hypothetical protein